MTSKTRSIKSWQVARSIVRIQSEDMTSVEENVFFDRYEKDEEFREDFLLINQGLARIEDLSDDPDVLAIFDEIDETTISTVSPGYRWAFVAGLIVAIGISILMQTSVLEHEEGMSNIKRYVTRTGEQKTIKLTDGSMITMNTATQLLVDIGNTSRMVTLIRGEAYFDVAKDPIRPFSVKVGKHAITVLGTEFNIMKLSDEFTLAVAEGAVGIHDQNEPLVTAPLSLDDTKVNSLEFSDPGQHRVTAGWVVNLDESRDYMVAYRSDKIASMAQWRTGLLRFEGIPLGEVVRQINRYSAKKILIEDPYIMNIEIYGSVQINSLDSALRGLEKSYPVKINHQFDSISLTGKK